jgi:hypothetical protein
VGERLARGILLPGVGNTAVTLGGRPTCRRVSWHCCLATIPLWMGLFSTIGPNAEPLGRQAAVGLALGFAGIALLIGPGLLGEEHGAFSPVWTAGADRRGACRGAGARCGPVARANRAHR